MGIFNSEHKFNIRDRVYVSTVGLEGTIIDVYDKSYTVEVYGDNMRRFVEVCNEDSLKAIK